MEDNTHHYIFEDQEGKRIEFFLDDTEYWSIYAGINPQDEEGKPKYPKIHFRALSKLVQEEVKRYRKGKMKHLSKMDDETWTEFLKENGIKGRPKQKGVTYVKDDSK